MCVRLCCIFALLEEIALPTCEPLAGHTSEAWFADALNRDPVNELLHLVERRPPNDVFVCVCYYSNARARFSASRGNARVEHETFVTRTNVCVCIVVIVLCAIHLPFCLHSHRRRTKRALSSIFPLKVVTAHQLAIRTLLQTLPTIPT